MCHVFFLIVRTPPRFQQARTLFPYPTLFRSEGSTTNYDDMAISRNLFDWQSQNSVSDHNVSGKNYINRKYTMLLFVREQSMDEDSSRRMGCAYLGEVKYVSHYGNAPMSIRWKLKNPMPASLWQFAGKLSSAL